MEDGMGNRNGGPGREHPAWRCVRYVLAYLPSFFFAVLGMMANNMLMAVVCVVLVIALLPAFDRR